MISPAQFRAAILRLLDANDTRYGLEAPAIARLLPAEGVNAPTSEVQAQINALIDLRMVREVNRPLDPERKAYAITADGRHQL